MKPLMTHVLRDHVLFGGIVAGLLLPKFGFWNSAVFWASTVLIDTDHYFRFLYLTRLRTLDVRKMQRFFERAFPLRNHPDFLTVELFHTIEFMSLFGVCSAVFFPMMLPVWWGFLFHIGVDFIHLFRHRAFTKRCHSFVEYWWRKKKIILRGGSPDLLFENILKSS